MLLLWILMNLLLIILCNETDIEKIGTQFYKCAVNSTKFNNINRLKKNYELNVVVLS